MIELSDVRFNWPGGERLLSIASLRIARGERIFVHGPSGSGKAPCLACWAASWSHNTAAFVFRALISRPCGAHYAIDFVRSTSASSFRCST